MMPRVVRRRCLRCRRTRAARGLQCRGIEKEGVGNVEGLKRLVVLAEAAKSAKITRWHFYLARCINQIVSLKSIYLQTRQLNVITSNCNIELMILWVN